MLRSVLMFFGFLFVTVMIIAMQPGPRLRDVPTAVPSREVTRSEATPLVVAADQVIAEAPRAVEPAPSAPAAASQPAVRPNVLAAERLKAVLTAPSKPVQQVRAEPKPAPQIVDVAPAPIDSVAVPQGTGTDSGLRAMTWDALGGLSKVTGRVSAPGQNGSLLNSVVRRSMQNVSPDERPRAVRQQGATYVVKSGDTLATIAIALYGSATAKQRLIAANRELLSSPDQLRVGQILSVPAN